MNRRQRELVAWLVPAILSAVVAVGGVLLGVAP